MTNWSRAFVVVMAIAAALVALDLYIFSCPLPPRFAHDMTTIHVRYQSTCGSCWAHATAAALEKRYEIKTGSVKKFDDSDLLNNTRGNRGCGGGNVETAYRFCTDIGLLSGKERVFLRSFENIAPATRCALKSEIMRHGPVTAHLLEYKSMKALRAGKVWSHLPGELFVGGHAVVVYGWDDDQGGWLVQNSWGRGWGDAGRGVFKYGEAELETHFLMAGCF